MKKLKSRVNRKTILPKEGEIIQNISIQNITPFDYIFNLAKDNIIDEINFIQFAGGAVQYKTLNKLVDKNRVKCINFFMCDFIIKLSAGTKVAVEELANRTNGVVKYYTNHVKYTLIHVANNYFVINSTANAAANIKIEYMEIHNNKEYYDYLINFIDKNFK